MASPLFLLEHKASWTIYSCLIVLRGDAIGLILNVVGFESFHAAKNFVRRMIDLVQPLFRLLW